MQRRKNQRSSILLAQEEFRTLIYSVLRASNWLEATKDTISYGYVEDLQKKVMRSHGYKLGNNTEFQYKQMTVI